MADSNMKVRAGRYVADLDHDVVVFIIGMRINKLHAPHKWLPVFAAMPKMITELMKEPELGLLARPRTFVSGRTVLLHQVWSSFDKLDAYARDRDAEHLPAWRAFNRKIRDDGSVGIFHETYLVGPGRCETVYGNMPPFGLGAALGARPAREAGQTAPSRLTGDQDDVAPVEPY